MIANGDHVILKKDDCIRLFQVQSKRTIVIEKFKFMLDGAIGHPYGTTFDVKDGRLLKVCGRAPHVDAEGAAEPGRDNRGLNDVGDAQKLSHVEIDRLRADGVAGGDIVTHLVQNSATFREKTQFSQQKYLRKKRAKYVARFAVLRPSTRILCQVFLDRGPQKVLNLRADSLAQMLTQTNIRAHSKVIVVESCQGLIVGAVLERLGGHGIVVQLHHEDTPPRQALDAYDFPKEMTDNVHLSFPLTRLASLTKHKNVAGSVDDLAAEGICKQVPTGGAATAAATEEDLQVDTTATSAKENIPEVSDTPGETRRITSGDTPGDTPGETSRNTTKDASGNTPGDGPESTLHLGNAQEASEGDEQRQTNDASPNCASPMNDGSAEPAVAAETETARGTKRALDGGGGGGGRAQRRAAKHRDMDRARSLLQRGSMDALIVATKFHPTNVVAKLIEFVGASRGVAVFSPYQEPLVDCFTRLRERGGIVNLNLTETWLRKYQVMPDRTHPEMNMSGTGGYLLTGIVVDKEPAAVSPS
ncbi:PREDICTED: tRNA (adenine(58)-N(1))-methyltransferase non-catalytic subunit TRM6-like [Priapulus caudatus]|uniref:tRNA (adenine(58)-N(1))-methyltransferase non-catalytic subunit TRM6 n=1 Tax=Priapulus caudatus TaxID=37621 RepID=A0ABM1EHG3_PRICU|nr:PREDICTED: tRNA (adenine(58)-N(1))-methyltransferase non-catalytic subunit TRM6-like [Priapulus caudatus]XP_014671634.1 PREDICTED: tRNA (adenine(58)-N(1))-methyltransferase non-catalytic subunit TRM6-like [Priapulus caudatus]